MGLRANTDVRCNTHKLNSSKALSYSTAHIPNLVFRHSSSWKGDVSSSLPSLEEECRETRLGVWTVLWPLFACCRVCDMPVTLGPELEPAATQRGLELLHGAQGLSFCPQLVMPYLIFIHSALLLFIRTDSSAVKETVVSLSLVEWSDERIDFGSRSGRSYSYIMFSQSKEKRKKMDG